MALSDLNTLVNASAQNTSQFKGLSGAYVYGGFGVPTIDGYTSLINTNNSTNFGAGGTTVFNDENVYINVFNALYQGNTTAKANFDAIVASAPTIQDKLTLVYNSIVPANLQTDAGRASFVSQSAFYTARAAELNIAGSNGAAVVGAASLMKIVVDNDVGGIGDSINDLRAAVQNGSAVIPQSGAAFTPIETADGASFDADDNNSPFTLAATPPSPPDNIVGTSGPDLIRAILANSLESVDIINGNAGTDTLTISAGALATFAAPVINGVEIINNADGGAGKTLNLASVSSVQQLWSNGAAVGADTYTYTNAQLATTFGVTGNDTGAAADTTVNVSFRDSVAGPSDTLKLAVMDNNNDTGIIASTQATSIEGLNISAMGTGSVIHFNFPMGPFPNGETNDSFDKLDVTAFTAVKAITVSGAGNISIVANSTALTSYDGSATTGSTAFQNSGAVTAAALTVTLGSGNDLFLVPGATGAVTVNGGSGDDSIQTGSGNDTLDGGLGADTMAGNTGSDKYVIKTSAVTDSGQDIILGYSFGGGGDTLSFGLAATATNYTEVVGGTDYLSALSTANTQFNGNPALKFVAVQAGADVFVFYDADGGGIATNGVDASVQLMGTNSSQIAFTDIVA